MEYLWSKSLALKRNFETICKFKFNRYLFTLRALNLGKRYKLRRDYELIKRTRL
jgi:hypothetical protein